MESEVESMTSEELRALEKELEEMTDTPRPVTIAWLRRHSELETKLDPYRCPMCFKIVYGEEYKVDFDTRWHLDCIKQRDEKAEELRKREKEGGRKLEQMRREVKEGLRPTTNTFYRLFTGTVPDFERFEKAVLELALKYNLEPWKTIEKGTRRQMHKVGKPERPYDFGPSTTPDFSIIPELFDEGGERKRGKAKD